MSTDKPIPRKGGVPLLYDYPDFQADSLNFWYEAGKQGPVVKARLGPLREFWIITDADLFQDILAKKSRNFPRDKQLRDRKGIDNTNTVFNAPTYEEWLWRRRLLQPAFHAKQLALFADTMLAETQQLIREVDKSQPVDLVFLMKTLTMRVICKTMFSASVAETAVLQECFETVSHYNFRRMAAAFKLPLWVPTPHRNKAKLAHQTRWDMIEKIVQARLASGKAKDDLLDMLIAAHLDEDGHSFSGHDLVSEMISIVFAGHDTTAMTMVWLFYTLSQQPEMAAKVSSEVDEVLNGRLISVDDLDNMPFTHQLIQETLRFYPTVYLTLREAENDDTLGQNLHIPAGTQIVINIRGMHRDPAHWQEPDRFWPERFTDEKNKKRHKFAYLPFLAGPKKCIGDGFAMMEMRLVIPTILQQIQFNFVGAQPIQEKAGFVMETAEPVMMRVEES